MLPRLVGFVTMLICLLPAVRASAQEELLSVLEFESAEIDYSGVELLMKFRHDSVPAHSHPYMDGQVLPVLSDGTNTYGLTPKGGNFEVIENDLEVNELWWTLRYRIDLEDRVTYDQSGFTVSWAGGTLAVDDPPSPSLSNQTEGSGSEPVTNRSRVDANGWTHLPVRTGTGVTAKAPDDETLDDNLYAWFKSDTGLYLTHNGGTQATADEDPVGRWEDQSVHDRHIVQTLDEVPDTEPDLRPELRTASSEQLGGKDVVRFNGATGGDSWNLQNATFGLNASTDSFSIAMVVRINGNPQATTGSLVWQHDGVRHLETNRDTDGPTNLCIRSYTAGGSAEYIQGLDVGSPPGEALVVILAWDHSSGTLNGWNLGHHSLEDKSGTPASTTGAWAFGGTAAGYNGFNGDIAEIAVYDRALNDTEAKALTAHFMDKYEIRPRTIYVNSAKADDNGAGLSTAAAKKTVAAGTALVRTGVGDRVLFKLGSVFENAQFQPKSGWSFDYPTLYGTYVFEEGGLGGFVLPTARPVFKIPQSQSVGIGVTGGSNPTAEYIALVGLDVYSYQRDPANGPVTPISNSANGIDFIRTTSRGILVEDCVVRWFHHNVQFVNAVPGGMGNTVDDIVVRRNIIHSAYHSQSGILNEEKAVGLYIEPANSTRILIEENVFDENGWYRHTAGGTNPLPDAKPNMYSHNIYIQALDVPAAGIVARGNLLTYGASHGIQMRPGGVLDQNVFYKNAIGAFTSDNDGVGNPPSLIWRCVFLDGRSPLWVWGGSQYDEAGRNWGFQFNRGNDTFMTECILALPKQTGFASTTARGLDFSRAQTTDRIFLRNNTIRVAERSALLRPSGNPPNTNAFAEFRADDNIISQPDSGSGVLLADTASAWA